MKLTDLTRPHTEQIHFTSQSPWKLKTVWVKALYHRANKICSCKRSFLKQVDQMETFKPWIGYLSYISNSIIKLLKTNQRKKDTNKEQDNTEIISLKLPYLGKQGVT